MIIPFFLATLFNVQVDWSDWQTRWHYDFRFGSGNGTQFMQFHQHPDFQSRFLFKCVFNQTMQAEAWTYNDDPKHPNLDAVVSVPSQVGGRWEWTVFYPVDHMRDDASQGKKGQALPGQ
jgi:hypothetical protein